MTSGCLFVLLLTVGQFGQTNTGELRLTVVDIRSVLPTACHVILSPASIQAQVTVRPEDTLLDRHRAMTGSRVGPDTLAQRMTALPGRSLPDLVNAQPGWLVEANGILHPRASRAHRRPRCTSYVATGPLAVQAQRNGAWIRAGCRDCGGRPSSGRLREFGVGAPLNRRGRACQG